MAQGDPDQWNATYQLAHLFHRIHFARWYTRWVQWKLQPTHQRFFQSFSQLRRWWVLHVLLGRHRRNPKELDIPWEKSKDQPFANSTLYIGFIWNLEMWTMSLSQTKIDKYSMAINEWLIWPWHNLKNVQELYGKLLHAASIIPQGCTYLTGLESMLLMCGKNPFLPLSKHITKNAKSRDHNRW